MTAWGSVDLAVQAMRQGARDFVQKPWENARLVSILRTQVQLGQALRRGERLEAENRALLESRGGEAVSRNELLRQVWGHGHAGGSNVVDAVVRGLRRKCGEHASMLETVRGVGYRLRL